MAPGKKQAARNEKKKVDDEPAADAGTWSKDGILSATKGWIFGSVLAEVGPNIAKLMKPPTEGTPKTDASKEGEENAEPDASTSGTDSNKPVAQDASEVLEGLSRRLSVKNPLGIDNAPDETWGLLARQEVDFGPYKRKKGSPATDRIMVNVERNMVPYMHILLALMCMRALFLRSWFACLPWLVGYQFLAIYAPVDVIRESFPKAQEKIPPVEDKHRVVATMCFHSLVWLFFLYEFGYQTYFLEKLLLILCFVGHAYIAAPLLDVEASRKAIAEGKQEDEKPSTSSKDATSDAKAILGKVVSHVQGSVLVNRSRALPELVKDIAASTKKEKTEDEKKPETTSEENDFSKVQKELTPYNILGLASSPEEATASWKAFSSQAVKIDMPAKNKKGAAKERILTNLEQHGLQYINILLGLMCLRAFLFRSWFACLPILVLCQFASLKVALPTVESKVRFVASMGFHILVWLFFVYETALMTHFLEKCVLIGMFIGHAFVAAPVVN